MVEAIRVVLMASFLRALTVLAMVQAMVHISLVVLGEVVIVVRVGIVLVLRSTVEINVVSF